MGLNVKWTPRSIDTYVRIVIKIQEKWAKKEADKFEENTAQVLSLITQNPTMYPSTLKKNVRRCVLSKQTSLYYKIMKTEIELISFWDNRQNPKKLKL